MDFSDGKIHHGYVAEIQGDSFKFLPWILTLYVADFAVIMDADKPHSLGLIHVLSTWRSGICIENLVSKWQVTIFFFHGAYFISVSRKIHAVVNSVNKFLAGSRRILPCELGLRITGKASQTRIHLEGGWEYCALKTYIFFYKCIIL